MIFINDWMYIDFNMLFRNFFLFTGKSPNSYFSDLPERGSTSGTRIVNDEEDDDGLGPLPPKWEKAYTESGEVYFIE